jgi:hypothetical protein
LSRSNLRFVTVVFTLALTAIGGPAALAQDADLQEQLDRMEKVIQQQQADLDAQRKQLAEQYELIRQLQAKQAAEDSPEPGIEPSPEVDSLAASDGVPVEPGDEQREGDASAQTGQEAAVAELERREQERGPESQTDEKAAAAATLYDPSNTIFDEKFPGAWHLPGTTAAMKIGGYVNVSMVSSFDPMLITDRFIVGSIPPEGQDVPGARSGTEVTASQSRINLEVREQTSRGQMRAFVEGDFEGQADTFRLRHAFGQFGSVLAGKTWTTFMDVDARPEEVDFEGINGEVLVRQSQIRFFPKIGQDYQLKISLEDPETEVVSGTGAKGNPDLVLSMGKLPFGDLYTWNYRVAFILRDLEAQNVDENDFDPEDPTKTKSARGWGISTSGQKSLSNEGESDAILWQLTYGEGIGRYLNDLNTVGGGDAVFDPNGELQPLTVFGGYVSYRHQWAKRWNFMDDWPGLLRSNLTLSWVWVDNYDFQDDKNYHSTARVSGNVLYFPTANLRFGAELLWGKRVNKDRSEGTSAQLQFSARYNF